MIGGSNEAKTSSYSPITGLGAVKVLAVNPSNADYTEITGRELPYNLDYDKRDLTIGETDITIQPINFLVYNQTYNIFEFIRFNIGNKEITTKKGDKFKFIDNLGTISYYIDDVSNISSKFNFNANSCRKLMFGEDDLHVFLQKLVRYNPRSKEANWMADLNSNGINYKNLYNNNLAGLNKFIKWVNTTNNFSVGVLFTVSVRTKEDGTDIINQHIESRSDLFYISAYDIATDEHYIPDGAFSALEKYIDKQEEAGYPITKRFYTINLDKCTDITKTVNYKEAPSMKAVEDIDLSTGSSLDSDDDDFPF